MIISFEFITRLFWDGGRGSRPPDFLKNSIIGRDSLGARRKANIGQEG